MYFLKITKIMQRVIFYGCFCVAIHVDAALLVIKPVEQTSALSGATPFPPRLHESPSKVKIKSKISPSAKSGQPQQSLKIKQTVHDTLPAFTHIKPLAFEKIGLSFPYPLNDWKKSTTPIHDPSIHQNSTEKDKVFFKVAKPIVRESNSIWINMVDNFGLNHQIHRPEVSRQINRLRRNKQELHQILKSAAPYISYVYQQTQKRGLPAELALLPVIESSFDPETRSAPGATGIWQIMPGTAHELGLKSNHAYDGRRDIVASTNAALKYLTYLHKTLNHNWELALAAYNSGPGRVQNAMKRQSRSAGNSHFWALQQLPAETRAYVPKLLALAEFVKNSPHYQFKLPAIESATQVTPIKVAENTHFKKLAEATGISLKTMKYLNPGYRKMTTVRGAPNTLLIPVEKATIPELNAKKAKLPAPA